MFRNIIGPVQAWLLYQGKCVGCGKELERPRDKSVSRVQCACGRIYIYDKESNKHRRATFDEIK